MAWPLIIAGAVALAGGIYKGVQANKQRQRLQEESDKVGNYKENPLAREMLGYSQSLYGGRMVGATNAEQNILANRANTLAAAERNATDSSQVLGIAASGQQMSDIAVNELGQLEARDKQNRYAMLQNAYQANIAEQDKVWQDKIRRMNQNMAIYGVYSKNMVDAVDSASSGVMQGMLGATGSGGVGSSAVGSVSGSTGAWSNAIQNPYK